MSIILLILKIIGIILLVLLGLILTAVVLVLFVPVRYRVSGRIQDEITIHVKVTWLLHLVSFVFDYQDGEPNSCLKILGTAKKTKVSALTEEFDEEEYAEEHFDSDDSSNEQYDADEVDTGTAQRLRSVEEANSTGKTKKFNFAERIKEKIQSFLNTLRKLKNTICQVTTKASALKDFIADEANQFVLLQVLAELRYLLRHFKFRKLETDLYYATGDPATTGQALGVLSMFPMLYQYQVSIVPDFESEEFYVKGTFEIRGRMRIVHVIRSLIRLIRQKEVRIFIKKILDR